VEDDEQELSGDEHRGDNLTYILALLLLKWNRAAATEEFKGFL
jgi:hypothetical protein